MSCCRVEPLLSAQWEAISIRTSIYFGGQDIFDPLERSASLWIEGHRQRAANMERGVGGSQKYCMSNTSTVAKLKGRRQKVMSGNERVYITQSKDRKKYKDQCERSQNREETFILVVCWSWKIKCHFIMSLILSKQRINLNQQSISIKPFSSVQRVSSLFLGKNESWFSIEIMFIGANRPFLMIFGELRNQMMLFGLPLFLLGHLLMIIWN